MNGVWQCARSSVSAQDPLTTDSILYEDVKPGLFCRCCLVTDQRLQLMDDKLAVAFERTIAPIVECESYLVFICTYCRVLLRKLTSFKDKCIAAQNALSGVQSAGLTMTLDEINNISKVSYPLKIFNLEHLDFPPKTTSTRKNTSSTENGIAHFVELPISYEPDSTGNKNTFICKTDELSNVKEECISHSEDDIPNDDRYSDQESDEDIALNELKSELLELPKRQRTKNNIKNTNKKIKKSLSTKIEIDSHELNIEDALSKKTKIFFNKVKQKEIKPELNKSKKIHETQITEKKMTKKQILKRKSVELECIKIKVKKVTLTHEEQKQEILKRRESVNYKRNAHKCDLCYHAFTNKLTYNNHMKKHQLPKDQVFCDVCYACVRPTRLKQHKTKFHTYNYMCELCDHISKSLSLAKAHYEWHTGVIFKCHICQQTYDKKTTLLSHMHIVHSELMLKCSICNKQCNGETGLRCHMNHSHKHAMGAVCASCHVQFHSVDALQRHRAGGGGLTTCTHSPCPACGEGFPSDVLLHEHKLQCWPLQNPGIYRCERCGKLYDDRQQYISHRVRSHQEERTPRGNGRRATQPQHTDDSLICDTCGCTKASRQSLANHMMTHTGEKRYKCSYCGRGFNVKSLLTQHIEAKHMGMAKQYKCSYCHKGFDFIGNMKRHVQMTHEKIRPFSCTICNKKFAAKEGLQSHVRHTHEGVPWPKRHRNK